MQGREFPQVNTREVIFFHICQIQFKRLTNANLKFLDGLEPVASVLGVVSWGAQLSFTLSVPGIRTEQLPASPGLSLGTRRYVLRCTVPWRRTQDAEGDRHGNEEVQL